jgi:hypothetical protein
VDGRDKPGHDEENASFIITANLVECYFRFGRSRPIAS